MAVAQKFDGHVNLPSVLVMGGEFGNWVSSFFGGGKDQPAPVPPTKK